MRNQATLPERLLFRNGRTIRFDEIPISEEGDLAQSFYIDELGRAWTVHGITDVILVGHGGLQKRIAQRIQKTGRSVTLVDAGTFELLSPTELKALATHILGRLAGGSAAVVFEHEDKKTAGHLAAALILTPAEPGLHPDEAVKRIFGRAATLADDAVLFRYMQALGRDFDLPGSERETHTSNDVILPRADEDLPEISATPIERLPSAKENPSLGERTKAPEAPSKAGKIEPAQNTAMNEKPVPVAKESRKETAPTPRDETPSPAAKAEPGSKADEKKANDAGPQVAVPKTALPEGPPPERAGDFKRSRFTIRVKLLSIISAIIIGSLSGMIFLAGKYFRDDTQTRIQENSLGLTRVIGLRIQSELESISFKVQLMATTLEEGGRKESDFLDLFFRNNASFVFVGIASQAGDGLKFSRTAANEKFLAANGMSRADVDKINQLNGGAFTKAFSGAPVMHNATPGSKVPLLGLGIPFRPGKDIIVVYVDPSDFLLTFKTTGITQTFLVGDGGDVIAHPDEKLVLTRTNLLDLPIVKSMLESRVEDGQLRYQDKSGIFHLGSYKKLGFGGGIISTVEEKKAFEEVENLRNRNLLIMILVVNGALLIVYFFAKTLVVPIVRLVTATREIEQGNYRVTIKPASGDEIGVLTNSFVNMAVGLEEREKMKDALGKFTNPEIAEMAMRGELKLGGERKTAAIFFSDLRGFTAMSESMQPEQVVEFLNEYFTGMVRCVDETNGVVDKFIGDAIMAHWGALYSRGNDTENAVNAALMMRKVLIGFNSRDTLGSGTKKPHAQIGCGINTGPVLSGQIGSETRQDYTVIGDTVNLASRIEALNKPFGTDILISQDSYNEVKDVFNCEEMPAIKVKGKSEPQTIYAVLGRKDDPECPKNMDEVRRLIGIQFGGKKPSAEALDGEEVKYEILDKEK